MPNKQIFVPSQDGLTGGDSPVLDDIEQQTQEGSSDKDSEKFPNKPHSQQDATEQQKVEKSDDKKGVEPSPVKFSAFKDIIGKQGATLEEDDDENELSQQELDARKKLATKEAGKEGEKTSTEEEIPSKTTELEDKTIKGQRDFTGIPENVVPVFKKMSNESFNALKPIYLEHEKQKEVLKKKDAEIENLKKGVVVLPDSYYEHPQGYLLDPAYVQAEVNTQFSQQILNHWNAQLIRIRKGEPWQDLIVDPKTGNASLTSPKEPTAEDEMAVLGYVQFAHNQMLEQQAEMKSAAKQFREKHSNDVKLLKEAETTYFPDFDKPEHPTASIQKAVLEALPPSMQKHPLASVLAKTAAANAMLRAEILNLQKGGKAQQTTTTENNNVTKGPKKGQASGGGGKVEKQAEVKFSDFTNLLNK